METNKGGERTIEMLNVVKGIMIEEDITQTELAKKVGLSRQRISDLLKRENANYNSIRAVMNALDRDLKIVKKDGGLLPCSQDVLDKVIEENAPMYGKLRAILDVLGYRIDIVKL